MGTDGMKTRLVFTVDHFTRTPNFPCLMMTQAGSIILMGNESDGIVLCDNENFGLGYIGEFYFGGLRLFSGRITIEQD